MVALLHDLLRHLVRHVVGRRALLARIREDADLVEAHLLDEVAQRVVLGIRLAREADDERRADRHAGDALAQLLDQRAHLLLCVGAAHAAQHGVVRMLQRQVDVLADLRLARNRLDELVAEVLRVAVERADPLELRHLDDLAQELRKLRRTVEVAAVLRRVLGDQDDFAHAVLRQVAHLVADVLDAAAAVVAADVRDGAEGAAVVAALCDLDISRVRRRRRDARRVLVVKRLVLAGDDDAVPLERLLDGLHDAAPGARADDGIRLRYLV